MRGYTLTQSADRVRIIPRASTSQRQTPAKHRPTGYELSSHDRLPSFLPAFPFPSIITSSCFLSPPPPLAGRPLIPCWHHFCHPFSTNFFLGSSQPPNKSASRHSTLFSLTTMFPSVFLSLFSCLLAHLLPGVHAANADEWRSRSIYQCVALDISQTLCAAI